MKKTHFLIFIALMAMAAVSAQNQEKTLAHFTKIVASPHINVVLQKGDHESIRLTCSNVSPDKINVFVSGNKLRIYLDHARVVEKQERYSEDGRSSKRGIYENASVTAYVTFRELNSIEVRGEQELSCADEIKVEKLKLRAYGQADIDLSLVNTRKFKASLYGENLLQIRGGEATHQVYRLFGENKIDTRGLESKTASTRIYGEGRLNLNASKELIVHAIGEPRISVVGSPHINKGVVIGRAEIR